MLFFLPSVRGTRTEKHEAILDVSEITPQLRPGLRVLDFRACDLPSWGYHGVPQHRSRTLLPTSWLRTGASIRPKVTVCLVVLFSRPIPRFTV